MMSLYTGEPLLYCVGCYQCVCSGPCLATHRDIYICHNAWCHFHAPPPAPPTAIVQRQSEPPAASTSTNNAPGTVAITASITQNTGDAALQTSLATSSGDSNVIYREAIAREWRQVGPGPNRTSEPSEDVRQSSNSPVRFSIEEYEAQARLLGQFQSRHNQEPRSGPRQGSEQGTNRTPRIQIIWE